VAINFATGSAQNYASKVIQFQYTSFDHQGYTGTSYQSVASVAITPRRSDSKIIIWAGAPVAYAPGHAGQGRFLRNGATFEIPSAGNRAPGHGGTEGVQSDGGGYFSMMVVDSPNTTSGITYTCQLGFEGGGVWRLNTSQNNYGDQGQYGYSGSYRSWMYCMEIAPN
jgi:hypothetical protein